MQRKLNNISYTQNLYGKYLFFEYDEKDELAIFYLNNFKFVCSKLSSAYYNVYDFAGIESLTLQECVIKIVFLDPNKKYTFEIVKTCKNPLAAHNLYHQIKDSLNNYQNYVEEIKRKQYEEQKLKVLFLSLGKVAKSDGLVKEVHIKCVQLEIAKLKLNEEQSYEAMRNFNLGKTTADFWLIFNSFNATKDFALYILDACWKIAWIDKEVGTREKQTLIELGKILGFYLEEIFILGKKYEPKFNHQQENNKQEKQQKSNYQKSNNQNSSNNNQSYKSDDLTLDEAFKILEVTAQDNFAHVKKAFRKLSSKHHPDKLGSNASAEEIKAATKKMQYINKAYALICNKKGWK